MTDAPRDAKAVFFEALEQESPESLHRFLNSACAGDDELRSRVEALLYAHQGAGQFLGGSASAEPTMDAPPTGVTERPGDAIGPYKLLQQIGEGGMGVVYMAEQSEPVERRVALKIIKPGMDSRQVIARFEAERQALAMMDHPNIAKVLDAGTTDTGRPYFVMELVKGLPITQYCDEQHLTPRERLELFLPICQAVQHAHQKGVIHRDLKPSNVLVAEYDDHAVPKIIDFGVAKAVSQRLTEKTMFTQYGQIIGTIEYMAPEQAKLNQLDVDTRSDIYSLGVLLYELLTGETPFDKQRLRSAAFDELLRIIGEEEPPRPSTRLSSSETLPSIAANRRMEPNKLSLLVRGELDWIVMKALEKDRGRRYESASAFAADVNRFLGDEPVEACPPSAGYRLRKFVHRNKGPMTVATVALLVLVTVAVGSTIAAGRFRGLAQRNADLAEDARVAEAAARTAQQEAEEARDNEKELRVEAQEHRDRAESNFALARSAVDEFLNHVTENELLTVPGLQPLRHDLLSSALEFYDDFTVDETNASQLLVEQATAHYRIALILNELGEGEQRDASIATAIELFEQLHDNGIDGVSVRLGLADCYRWADRHDEAVRLCLQILETQPDHAATRCSLADAYNALGSAALNEEADMASALENYQQALTLREGLVRDDPENAVFLADLGQTFRNLGAIQGRLGVGAEMENWSYQRERLSMFEYAIQCQAEAVVRKPQQILSGHSLAQVVGTVAAAHAAYGNQEEALKSFERLVALRRKLAFENPAVPAFQTEYYLAWMGLGNYQGDLRAWTDAQRSFDAAREILESIAHPTRYNLADLATVYGAFAQLASLTGELSDEEVESERQRFADMAMDMLEKAVESGFRESDALQNDVHLGVIRERKEFKQLLERVERDLEAGTPMPNDLVTVAENADVLQELIGDDPPDVRHRILEAAAMHSVGEIQIMLEQFAEAEQTLREALRKREELLVDASDDLRAEIDVVATQYALGLLYWKSDRLPRGHRTWQDVLLSLDSLAARVRDNPALVREIANFERSICHYYGNLGLWRLAAEHGVRNMRWTRNTAVWSDAWFAPLLLLVKSSDAYLEYCRQYNDYFRSAIDGQTEKDRKLTVLVWMNALADPPALPGEVLVEQEKRAFEISNEIDGWMGFTLALAHYRAGQNEDALRVLIERRGGSHSGMIQWMKTGGPLGLSAMYLSAMLNAALGNDEDAERDLQVTEEFRQSVYRKSLEHDDRDLPSPFGTYWFELVYAEHLRREVWEALRPQWPLEDPWGHLLQARGYIMIGESEQANTELNAVGNAENEDVQIAKERLLALMEEMPVPNEEAE